MNKLSSLHKGVFMQTRKHVSDELSKMAERYAIVKILKDNVDGLTFKYLKNNLKMKELRLKTRLSELEEHGYIIRNGNIYLYGMREE